MSYLWPRAHYVMPRRGFSLSRNERCHNPQAFHSIGNNGLLKATALLAQQAFRVFRALISFNQYYRPRSHVLELYFIRSIGEWEAFLILPICCSSTVGNRGSVPPVQWLPSGGVVGSQFLAGSRAPPRRPCPSAACRLPARPAISLSFMRRLCQSQTT